MAFAADYLISGTLFKKLIDEDPDRDTGIIVVIPAFNELDITDTLNSLAEGEEPECKTEVLIIVNAPPDSDSEGIRNNYFVIENIESWKKQHVDCFFRLYYLNVGQPDISQWGVGLARKTGMDEAIRRFDSIDNPDGVIASLDADCRIEKNYFRCLFEELLKRKERKACSIYFEHPVRGDLPTALYTSIILYELHLRYYFQALKYTGFPYIHHTIGSAIAIKASAYVKAGGMNRRQAGEDFYFIQKLVPAGGFFNLYGTTIYPSPRISLRVPFFSTGIVIGKLSTMTTPEYYTYDFNAFNDLHQLFGLIDFLFLNGQDIWINIYSSIPEGLRLFIGEEEWLLKLTEIKGNTSNTNSFTKRFYNWFNMFKIVKYLNFVHGGYYNKKEIVKEAEKFLENIGKKPIKNDPAGLLLYYRYLEKSTSYFPD
jgi:hypothetical protein